jgi:hypothetical protein
MILGFQCSYDVNGDIVMADGVVVQPKTGVRIAVGSGVMSSTIAAGRVPQDFIAAMGSRGVTFLGGSGNNVISEGLVDGLSSGEKPVGFFRPISPGVWKLGAFVLEVTGPSAATISDATNVIAELTSGGTAPVGAFDSTTYGETTYNGSDPFTLTVTAEGGTGGFPDARVEISAGSAIGGIYEAVDQWSYESVDDADWTIEVASDGTANLRYLTDVVATRSAGSPANPFGSYDATALGKADYNLTDAEPVDGEPWVASVGWVARAPRVGYVYLEVVEVSGVLDAVNGPFFGSSLPSNFTDTYYVEVAYSDGYAMRQDQIGAIIWP